MRKLLLTLRMLKVRLGGPSGNNTKTSVRITEPLVTEVPQSPITHHASTSSYHVAQDRWSRDQHIKLVNIISDLGEGILTRSMAVMFIAASASECLFADFLSKIEPKKEEGINYDETFAPVARMEDMRIFLAFATYMNFIPHGFESSEFPDVGKLDKALYGLKHVPRAWFETLSTFLIQNKYQANPKELHLIAMKRIFSAKKQQSVPMSFAEAKYVAAAGCSTNIL
ncbi:hypothetical protein Tco_1306008 [Tanacetum coccineum]